ncbi:MAG: class I SAM-dependent methyltransferase [Bryobacterales bacterium]
MRLSLLFSGLLFSVLLFSVAAACWAQTQRDSHHHGSRSPEEWVKILENPDRDAWQKPDEVIEKLGLAQGAAVADIGAGSGYFSVRLARAVGPQGTVFAADIDEGLIEYLVKRSAQEGLHNLKPLLGRPDDPLLPPASVDLVFICDVIHHIEDRGPYYSKLARALRPGGRLVIVDFYKRELPVGPPPAMKIAKTDLIAELGQAGFGLREEFDLLPYQYFLIFETK